MNAMRCFNFGMEPVRVVELGGKPWFVAADVCRVLEIENNRDAVSVLDEDEKADVGITDTSSNGTIQGRKVKAVSESGLYSLIFKSRKPQARKFRRWVTGEVLPALREHGRYELQDAMQQSERGRLCELRELLLETARDVRAKRLTPGQAQAIAITASRYLETLKLEGEALGYEKVLGLRADKTHGGFLPRHGQAAPDGAAVELLQELPQPEVLCAEEGEPSLPPERDAGEAGVGEAEPGAETPA